MTNRYMTKEESVREFKLGELKVLMKHYPKRTEDIENITKEYNISKEEAMESRT